MVLTIGLKDKTKNLINGLNRFYYFNNSANKSRELKCPYDPTQKSGYI